MIYETIDDQYQLRQRFRDYGREGSFTRYDLLFNFLDTYEYEKIGYKLDVIEICGAFNEFNSVEDFNKDYGTKFKSIEEIDGIHLVIFDDEDKPFLVEAF
jgi:hypothetical protein